MTQHPFKDLPEEASVIKDGDGWMIENNNTEVWVGVSQNGYNATFDCFETSYHGTTPNEAFQALRAAVREMANDLGVM